MQERRHKPSIVARRAGNRALLVIAGVLGVVSASESQPRTQREVDPRRRTPVVEAVERAGPAVVSLVTERVLDTVPTPLFRPREGVDPSPGPSTLLGSGLLIDPRGFIVTNYHVVQQASRITVWLQNDTSHPAELVNWDRESDLAVIRITASEKGPFPYLPLGSSSDLLAGEPVIALGNPFGLGNSVTTGVVSARSRTVSRDGKVLHADLIQTDALINIGNSGGPLLNITGEVIGINLGILEEGQGIGFAIPADRVRQAVASLLDFRTGRMLRLGIPSHGLREEASPGGKGLLVLEVEAEGPAAQAGIRKGDLLLSADGRPLSDALDLHLHLFLKSVGEVVVVRAVRGKQEVEARITLGRHQDIVWELLGMVVRDVTDDLGTRLELPPDRWYGVYVVEVEPGGPADAVLIRPGDILYFLGQFQINGIQSLRSLLLARFERGQLVPVNLWRSETREELQGGLRLRP